MSYFDGAFGLNLFQLTKFSLGNLETDDMGIEIINEKTLVNYIIYACFIFIMPILFLNIFQSISIGEIQQLYEDAEANEIRNKIEYIFLVEAVKNIKYFPNCIFVRLDCFMRIVNCIIEKIKIHFSEKRESNATHSKEKSLDNNLIKDINGKINAIDKKVEQNFDDIKTRMENLQRMFQDEMNRKEEKRQKKAKSKKSNK